MMCLVSRSPTEKAAKEKFSPLCLDKAFVSLEACRCGVIQVTVGKKPQFWPWGGCERALKKCALGELSRTLSGERLSVTA